MYMDTSAEKQNLDFQNEEAKLKLSSGFETLIGHIEGPLTDAHLKSLILNEARRVLGGLQPEQEQIIEDYIEEHPSYSKIDPQELAREVLDVAA